VDEGKIVERGHHDALVRLNGRYANLFALQSREGEKTLKNPPKKMGDFSR
jgi:ABC-type transport system involved in cytochrome bd biosynthesis fused ATPase/permease subunit